MPTHKIKNGYDDGYGHKLGIENIAQGIDQITIVFSSNFSSVNYSIDTILKNVDDTEPNHYTLQITEQLISGFTVQLSNTTLTDKYKLIWKAFLE